MKVFVLTQICGEPASAYCEGVFSTKEKALEALDEFYKERKSDWLNPEKYGYDGEDIEYCEKTDNTNTTKTMSMYNTANDDFVELTLTEMEVE